VWQQAWPWNPGQVRDRPPDRVVVGLMGCGGSCTGLIEQFARRFDVAVKYLCDVDSDQIRSAQRRIGRNHPAKCRNGVSDFRRMLDDPEVDAIINATPCHWHGLGTILACQAGKHVYVEKVPSHNIWEGRKMVEGRAKYNRVVQAGMQCRSQSMSSTR